MEFEVFKTGDVLKVLIVSKYYPPHWGGVESHAEGIAKELMRSGVDVEVLCSNTERKPVKETRYGVRVTRLPTWATVLSQPINPGMVRYVRKSDADIVHVHVPNPLAMFMLMGIRKKVVYTYHSDILGRPFLFFFNRFIKWKLSKADAVIATSQRYVDGSSVLKGLKVDVVPNFIRLADFRCTKPKGKKILFIGRFSEYKGLDYLLKAYVLVARKHPESRLVMMGNGLKENLRQETKGLGIDKNIVWLSNVDEKEKAGHFADCKMLVLPSTHKTEAFGIVQLEAMASGKPVVSTNIKGSGVPWVNVNGRTGIVVEPQDAQALADAICKLLEDDALAAKMGKAGRARVEKYFDTKIAAKKTLELYKRVLR